ncbi:MULTISPECIES: hypothetical protein [unclassified Pannonibacter]|nr:MULTISPECIES: hypothetical protein [unclassified Pannonibacter]
MVSGRWIAAGGLTGGALIALAGFGWLRYGEQLYFEVLAAGLAGCL